MSQLVQYLGESLHEIRDEINRWREILAVPYQEHLQVRHYKSEAGVTP